MYSIFRDGRRQDGQPDGKTGIKRPEQIVRDRIETEQDIEVWTRTRSYSAAPTPMRRNIILTKNNYDESSSGLLISEIRRNRQELFESLSLYYRVFIKKEDVSALLDEEDDE